MSFEGLNIGQRAAVETLSGPLLVLAGAGTGKTRVVTFRIANLIKHGTQPDRILAVTFTNKAAAEMQERVAALLPRKAKSRPIVATFHAYCVRILRRNIARLGYPDRFAIVDRGEQESLARGVLREIRVPGTQLRPGDLLSLIGNWKTQAISPKEAAAIAETDKEHLAAIAFRRYQLNLKNRGSVDFDDLLLCTNDLFDQCPDVRDEEASRFDHLLVDEYQDTNTSQYKIVQRLAAQHRNLCVVGDDDQSIYGWRGAEVKHILRFSRDWPEAATVRLEENYRSTAAILQMANRLISFNKNRHVKTLRPARAGGQRPRIEQYKDEVTEAAAVVGDIKKLLKRDEWEPRDFAVLFRTNEQPRTIETELRKQEIPYVLIGGMSFFDRKEVRDVLAYLKLLAMPEDEISLLRIINTPARGISKATTTRLLESAVSQGTSVWNVMVESPGKGDKSAVAVQKFCSLLNEFRGRLSDQKPSAVARSLIQHIDYESELRRTYEDPNESQSRWDAVAEVINAMADFEAKESNPDLLGFLNDLALDGQDFKSEKDNQLKRNSVVLMTLHSAKGLEFPHVYMVGLEEGILPHHRSLDGDDRMIEEERRLCYVGVTRAREYLTLTMALTRRKWGKPRDSIPSPFLFELIGEAENPATPQQQPAQSTPRTPHDGPQRASGRTK